MCLNIFVGILVVLFVIHNINRYTLSVNCCWKYSIATITKLLNTQSLEPVTPQPHLFRKTDLIINLELPHGCGSLVTPMTLTHSVYPIRNRSKNKHRNLWIGYVSSWCSSGNKYMYFIVRNRASCSAAYFVYKLLYKSDYFTSSWYLIRWVCNSISAFKKFHLNYGLRLSLTLYFWFYNYSPRSDISALQYWVEYVTLRLIWVKVIYSQLGYSAGMFQPLQLIALVVFDAVN